MAFLGLVPDLPKEVTLKMSGEDATREAVGKALGLIGTSIGIVGTVLALSANPAMKAQAQGVWTKMPDSVQKNKAGTLILLGLLGATALYFVVKKKVGKQTADRYATT